MKLSVITSLTLLVLLVSPAIAYNLISVNAGGTNKVIITPDPYIEGFFIQNSSRETIIILPSGINITLFLPPNASSLGNDYVELTWNVTKDNETSVTCNITLDNGVVAENLIVPNNTRQQTLFTGLNSSDYNWSVFCVAPEVTSNSSIFQFSVGTAGQLFAQWQVAVAFILLNIIIFIIILGKTLFSSNDDDTDTQTERETA